MQSDTSVTITCGIQTTGIVTMAIKVLHNTCNMCIRDLPDMYPLIPQASGIHIRQIPHVPTITCNTFTPQDERNSEGYISDIALSFILQGHYNDVALAI